MPTIEEWYRGIPPITRAWFTASLVTSILFTTGVPVVQYLPLNWDLILHRFEVWRLLTGFIVFGGLSFNILITYYMMYTAHAHSRHSRKANGPCTTHRQLTPQPSIPVLPLWAGVSTCERWR